MAAYKKILKNLSSPPLDIEISEVGVTILTSENYTIDPVNYLYWAKPETIAELTPYINSGDIVVNNGVVDLAPSDGIRFLEYADRLDVKFDGNFITKIVKDINIEGDATVTNTGDGSVTILVGETGSVVGKPLQFQFQSIGLAINKWLTVGHPSVSSDDVPWVAPGGGTAVAITFSNSIDEVDTDLEVYVNGILQYTWDIRDKRTSWIVLNSGLFTISQGDRVSIFARGVSPPGDSPQNISGMVVFSTTSLNDGEGGTQIGV